jgi:hypothetical protein
MAVLQILVDDDDNYTAFAGAAVVGSRFVNAAVGAVPTGNGNKPTVQHATAAGWALGVSVNDQPVVGGDVAIQTDGVVAILATGAYTAGQRVSVGANGTATAQTSTNPSFGVFTASGADASYAPVALQGL